MKKLYKKEARLLRELAGKLETFNNEPGEKIDLSFLAGIMRETAAEAEKEDQKND